MLILSKLYCKQFGKMLDFFYFAHIHHKYTCTGTCMLKIYIKQECELKEIGVRVMVFNATFNNISVISWWSV